jgi:hypothetical protein
MAFTANKARVRKPKPCKFYLMSTDPRIGKVGWQMVNLQLLPQGRRVVGPPRGRRGFGDFPKDAAALHGQVARASPG